MSEEKSEKQRMKELRTCVTPEFRVSFPVLFKPKAFKNNAPKFSLVMLFDKKTDLKALKQAVFNAAVEKYGKDKAKWPKKLKMPFRDGDVDKAGVLGYENIIFITATAPQEYPPGVVNQRLDPIINESELYAGCYARAQLYAYPYDNTGNIGITFGLNNVQKLRDGEKFSGRQNAENVFEAVEDAGMNDESNYESDDIGF
jgi:hypothetical protein